MLSETQSSHIKEKTKETFKAFRDTAFPLFESSPLVNSSLWRRQQSVTGCWQSITLHPRVQFTLPGDRLEEAPKCQRTTVKTPDYGLAFLRT